jgi:hypothetical protein
LNNARLEGIVADIVHVGQRAGGGHCRTFDVLNILVDQVADTPADLEIDAEDTACSDYDIEFGNGGAGSNGNGENSGYQKRQPKPAANFWYDFKHGPESDEQMPATKSDFRHRRPNAPNQCSIRAVWRHPVYYDGAAFHPATFTVANATPTL